MGDTEGFGFLLGTMERESEAHDIEKVSFIVLD
jgi:hypothetical protein